jgi:hypothetical protein
MAYEWNKTAFVEFEAMLRRRLRSGAAPVVACAGFDLDAASAYLEGALGGSHRAGYESHLAGCAACRRHLIELARLERTAPQVEAQPVKAADQTPAWARWREVVAGWFDLSAWNLKWQLAGATGAAFAILIAVLGVQSWRQASDQSAFAGRTIETQPISAEAGVLTLQSPAPEASLQSATTPVAEDLAANNQGYLQIPAPRSLAIPKGDSPPPDFTDSVKLPTLSVNQSAEAPIVARSDGAQAGQNPPSQPRTFVESESLSNVSGSLLIRDDSKEQANDIVQSLRITPSQVYNPMNPEQPDPNHKTQVVESPVGPSRYLSPESSARRLPRPESLKLTGIAKELVSRIRSKPKSESMRKGNDQPSEDESPKPMMIPIRDKVFRFEKGTLIDREYNSDMQKWRVWTLKRGSEAYKQVLASEPQLKEFFDRGPILIVWKNRIYKVLK